MLKVTPLKRFTLAGGMLLTFTLPALAGPNEDLAKAVEAQDLKGVQRALQQKADPNADPEKDESTIYYSAFFTQNAGLIRLLTQAGGDRKVLEEMGHYLFLALIYEDKLEMLRFYLEQGLSPNFLAHDESEDFYSAKYGHSYIEKTPLHYAGVYGRPQAAKLLFDFKADVNARAQDGSTPLMTAIRSYNAQEKIPRLALIRLLLARGADVGLRDDIGQSALLTLLSRQLGPEPAFSSAEALELAAALGKGQDPLQAAKDGSTPLELAVKTGEQALVRLLLVQAGPQARTKALNAATALAAQNGKLELVKALLAQGADLRQRSADGASLLMLAARSGNEPLVRLLLSKGLSGTETDSAGGTALHYAARGGSLACFRLLFSKAELERKTERGRTPLMEAAAAVRPEISAFLLTQGADVNDTDAEGATALLLAAASDGQTESNALRLELIQSLLQKGALTTVLDYQQRSLLHYATLGLTVPPAKLCGFDTSVAEFAARQKLDINARDNAGRTALMNAVHGMNARLIALMLEKGADPRLKSKAGKTAADELGGMICYILTAGDIPTDTDAFSGWNADEGQAIAELLKKYSK